MGVDLFLLRIQCGCYGQANGAGASQRRADASFRFIILAFSANCVET
jgi:hypothetical protein